MRGERIILLATSGSRSSTQATVYSAELAAAFSAVLWIVHVVLPVKYKVGRLAPMVPVQCKLADPFASPVLRQARELAWRHGVAASLQLLAGEPARAIVAAAERSNAGLLVIGAPSKHRALLRTASTRRRIEAHAPCQILTPPLKGEATWPSVWPSGL